MIPETSPIARFQSWYEQELEQSTSSVPDACCLSTMGLDGYPNARFVALKSIEQEQFIVTGPTRSRKGRELEQNGKVALTFWWPATERQVRIQGDAQPLAAADADRHFQERSRASRLVSLVCAQGEIITSFAELESRLTHLEQTLDQAQVPRPENWGGWSIEPIRIELLAFRTTRMHERILFERISDVWQHTLLQP